MPPTNGPGFCKYVAGVGANVLFDPKAAEALKTSAKTQGLASTEDASGKSTAFLSASLLSCSMKQQSVHGKLILYKVSRL